VSLLTLYRSAGLASPASIDGLQLWLDAADTSTITESGGDVSEWRDKSGNGNDVTQATAADQPVTGTRTINGLNVLDFTGTSWMRTVAETIISQPVTVFAVVEHDVIPAVGHYIYDSRGAANRHGFVMTPTTMDLFTTTPSLKAGTAETGIRLYMTVANSPNSSIAINAQVVGTGDTGAADFDMLTLGRRHTSIANLDGAIAEILIYDSALSDSDREAVETYLADKWGISIPGSVGQFTWDSNTSSPAASQTSTRTVTNTHLGMKRCVVNDAGVVQYYLNPQDYTEKEDGTAANLDGTDGQVMVEIPKFYTRRTVSGTETTWSISDRPRIGFTVHPAFVKDGVEVDYRYYGAYHASYLDATDSTYKSGLNLNDLTSSLDLSNDKLGSVSGVYPIVGATRDECRQLAANRGTVWRQLDFTLWSAVQLLYLVEYQTFYSQDELGGGNTADSYVASSSTQADSPHSIAGRSNSLGNASTDTTSGADTVTDPPTAFMSYRGIENFFGNAWQWVDGINVNVGGTGNAHVTNNRADFADDTSSNMTLIASSWPTTSDYIVSLQDVDNYFVPLSLSGGSSSTYVTDTATGSSSSNQVVRVGGDADNGAQHGAFSVVANVSSLSSARWVGARLAC